MAAVRAQQRFVGLDLVVRLVQQRQVQTDAQHEQGHQRQREIQHQHQHLREVGDVDQAQSPAYTASTAAANDDQE